MCLIHTLDSKTVISDAWLKNIYQKNSNGIGAMLIEDGRLVVKKALPKNARRALKWFRANVEGRSGIVHWRFATHGEVNLANCHPYPVLTEAEDGINMYLMHNGVMDEFSADTTLADVYTDDYSYLRPRRKTLYGQGHEHERHVPLHPRGDAAAREAVTRR